MSTILLENNGRRSSGKKTRHVKIRYFFITDNIKRDNVWVEYCPTEDMVVDCSNKPLQGSLFRKLFRTMGCDLSDYVTNSDEAGAEGDMDTDLEAQECVESPVTELGVEMCLTDKPASSSQINGKE